jgi:hypothetical protein
MDYTAKIQQLEAKREKLEARLDSDRSLDKEEKHDIRQQIIAVGQEITAYVAHQTAYLNKLPPAAIATPTAVDKQEAALLLLSDVFEAGTRVFGTVDAKSDELSECAKSQPWAAELKSQEHACVACGWKKGVRDAAYPGEAARRHAVSIAHIVPNDAQCRELGVPFDRSNFLPLCGAKDEVPSCHSAFDRHLLCFVKQPGDGHHLWTVHTSTAQY